MYLRVLTRNERSTVKMQLVWEETFPQRRAIGDWLEQARRKISVAKSGTENEYKQSIYYLSHSREGCGRQISVKAYGKKRYSTGNAICIGPGYCKPEKMDDDMHNMA